MKKPTGTREWSQHSANLKVLGCSHGCKYCYGREMALRYKRICTADEWTTERFLGETEPLLKKQGIVMFPTVSDISPTYLGAAIKFLIPTLKNENQVLIVIKPHLECVKALCRELKQFKPQIMFRFTITTIDPNISKFWEPGAPLPRERVNSLRYAFKNGFATSVSVEPMLCGPKLACEMFYLLSPMVTDTIWFGKMNKIAQRVHVQPTNRKYVRLIKMQQTDDNIRKLYNTLKSEQKVRWKDSIQKVLGLSTTND